MKMFEVDTQMATPAPTAPGQVQKPTPPTGGGQGQTQEPQKILVVYFLHIFWVPSIDLSKTTTISSTKERDFKVSSIILSSFLAIINAEIFIIYYKIINYM